MRQRVQGFLLDCLGFKMKRLTVKQNDWIEVTFELLGGPDKHYFCTDAQINKLLSIPNAFEHHMPINGEFLTFLVKHKEYSKEWILKTKRAIRAALREG